MESVTYARARLWTGITGVGTFVVLAIWGGVDYGLRVYDYVSNGFSNILGRSAEDQLSEEDSSLPIRVIDRATKVYKDYDDIAQEAAGAGEQR